MLFMYSCSDSENGSRQTLKNIDAGNFKIGWSSVDITPEESVLIRTQWVSEGVMDPVTATVLALESGNGPASEKIIFISCDLAEIPDGGRYKSDDNLRDNIRRSITESIPELEPEQIILNATHTHSAPFVLSESLQGIIGIDMDIMHPKEYQDMISARIAGAVKVAWNKRKPGGISYGLGHAIAGNNRIQVDFSGSAQMHGNINRPEFSHLEGFTDHSVNLLYTWDDEVDLTGVVINLACTSQFTYGYLISSDFWHDVRENLKERMGPNFYVLPQTGAAGDQSPHDIIIDRKAERRMQKMMYPDEDNERMRQRKDIATRISDAVTSVLPYMKDSIEWDPLLSHKMKIAELPKRIISLEDIDNSLRGYPGVPENATRRDFEKQFEQLVQSVMANPSVRNETRWYSDILKSYAMIKRAKNLEEHYNSQFSQPVYPVEIHAVRAGDIVFATNPFELYLDYGTRIKARSPAIQTFVVQLAGSGTYLPVSRSVAGGAYGAVPASNTVGPEGGQELVESTLDLINSLWEK